MPPIQRRDLLKGAAAFAPSIVAGNVISSNPKSGTVPSRLLVVFLRGAYDATSIIVPTGSDFYYQSRPTIALARPNPADPKAALPLDGDWSLHPALKESILPLWRQRQIAFVPFAGTDDLSRSHFETQDTIELGQPVGGSRNYGSGFLARLAQMLGRDDRPIAFTDQLPLCFRGDPVPVPNLGLTNVGKPIDRRQTAIIESMYGKRGQLAQSVAEGFHVRETVFDTLDQEMKAAGRGAVSSKGFELSARRIGALMRDRFNLAFVDVGGWDTHVNQGNASGYLADRIGELGRGLAGFVDALGARAWGSTTVVVVSEFGRTFRENGDKGTDHGHGSIYWVMGGDVAGGRMAGAQVALSAATLNQARDLPVLTDYRALIGGLVARQYGLSADRMATVFPQARPADLKLV